MSAKCCGGEFDLFLGGYIHEDGCPERETSWGRQRVAEERLEEGREDAFRSSSSSDPSYKLGKKLEEQRQVDHVVNNVFGFPIGGNSRRHNRRLF